MSRSNPTSTQSNPSTRWFEWDSDNSCVKYYDKVEKKSVSVKLPFTFLVLDQTASITGWHESSTSGIYSNEVRSTKASSLLVRSFKGGTIAQGIYQDIKEKTKSSGGKFTANVYIAYKDGGEYKIGAIMFKGASLQSWSDFSKANRSKLETDAIQIASFETGKKGKVTYTTPTFKVIETSKEAEAKAIELDKVLQAYLNEYMGKAIAEETTSTTSAPSESEAKDMLADHGWKPIEVDEDLDSLPF
jgi:hypothetical protein